MSNRATSTLEKREQALHILIKLFEDKQAAEPKGK